MGNFIKTRNGVDISLEIPAQITSFESNDNGNENSHVTKGKLKVFSIGKTGDMREFTREFSEKLVKTLPGTPIVAYYDYQSEDFVGHNDEQYVYGYVPEDATVEFVEENGATWAYVDVNLFTERKDAIGEVANKIIGKAQSLELNPDTVDWELIYVNNKLQKIVFKEGSFYGLSVLGDEQKPAFSGSGFFTKEVIEEFRNFQKSLKNDGGEPEMDIENPIQNSEFVENETPTEVVVENPVTDSNEDFTEETPVEAEDEFGCGKKNQCEDEENAACGDKPKEATEAACGDKPTEAACGDKKSECEKCEDSEVEGNDDSESDSEDGKEEENEAKKKQCGAEEIATNASSLSQEERNELEELRREKKMSLIEGYKEFLSDESLKDLVSTIDSFDLKSLERELKIMSFDANKEKFQKQESNNFGNYVLPTFETKKTYSSELEELVAKHI